MDGSTVTDFSIERILSPQLGHKPQGIDLSADTYLRGVPGGFTLDYSGNFRPSAPVQVPVPVPGCLQYRGMSFGEGIYTYGAAFHPTEFSSFYPNSGVCAHSADAQALADYHGYSQAALSAQAQQRHKSRMRTVFTDSQSRQLEALFELTDYPAVEARAEVARRTGLSEETVRVWFKNRRARRKRQCSGSKAKSPSPPPPAPCTAAEKKPFIYFL